MTEETRAPVKYTVLEKSLIGNELFEAGQTCEYAGLPAENLAPQCADGEARYQEYLASNAARVKQMIAANSDASVGDAAAFAAAFRKDLADANARHEESQATLLAALQKMQEGQVELVAAAVAAAIAQVFPNGTAKKAADPSAPIA